MRRCRDEVSDAWQDCFSWDDAVAAVAARAGDVVTVVCCVLVSVKKLTNTPNFPLSVELTPGGKARPACDVARTVRRSGCDLTKDPVIHAGWELVFCVFFRVVEASERGERVQAATACGGRRETRMSQRGDRSWPHSA